MEGKLMHSHTGKPSCLDPTGWSKLVLWMRANPDTDKAIINAEIRLEFKNSWEMRCLVNRFDNRVPPKISWSTVRNARLKLLALSVMKFDY